MCPSTHFPPGLPNKLLGGGLVDGAGISLTSLYFWVTWGLQNRQIPGHWPSLWNWSFLGCLGEILSSVNWCLVFQQNWPPSVCFFSQPSSSTFYEVSGSMSIRKAGGNVRFCQLEWILTWATWGLICVPQTGAFVCSTNSLAQTFTSRLYLNTAPTSK